MLNHQAQFAIAVKEIYKPISGRMSDVDSLKPEGNPDGVLACEEYETIVEELKETLSPELEMIETRVVKPAQELLDIFKLIRKVNLKRDHKQLDYDRHRTTLKKLQDKKDKTLKDEKALYRAEADVEQATQEYEYYNDLLKADLPRLFQLESEFIKPLFQNFYYMQLNIFYTLNERMSRCDIPYFRLDRDILEAYHEKKGNVQEQAELIGICKYKLARGPSKFDKSKLPPSPSSSKFSEHQRASSLSETNGSESLPPYSPGGTINSAAGDSNSALGRSYTTGTTSSARKPPPPPPTKPSTLKAPKEVAVALYDYVAQAEGDLSFKAGDRIEVVQRTASENDWWTGKVNGAQGVFPGNYTKLE